MGKAQRRILIYRLGSLGDTIVALPALQLVRRTFPDAERLLLTNFPINQKAAAAAAVLDGTGLLDGYVQYPVGARSLRVLVGLWWKLLRLRPAAVVYLAAARGESVARRDANFFKLCGISKQYGVPLTKALQENVWQPERGAFEPECERLVRTIAELGDGRLDDPESWDLNLARADHERAAGVLAGLPEKLIAVGVGTKMQAKDWGEANWTGLLALLNTRYRNYGLVLLGAAEEHALSERVMAGWAGAALNCCGKLSVRESAAVLQRAGVFVGHDSGPMHLAAAVQTACVAVFSSQNLARIWFPYGAQHRVIYHEVDCMGCRLETCTIEGKKCILSITGSEVLEAVATILGDGAV